MTPLPHDPGHQHHGGLVEGVEEADELLPLRPKLPERDAEHHGEQHQTQDVHTVRVCTDGDLQETGFRGRTVKGLRILDHPPWWNQTRSAFETCR